MYTKPHISTFEGGMNTDVSHHKMAPNMYIDAGNIRILTEEGLSSGAIVNEFGNDLLVGLPADIWPTYKYKLKGNATANYLINTIAIPNVPDSSAQKAYDYLIDYLDTNHSGWNSLFRIYLNRKEITVHCLTNITVCTVDTVQMDIRGAHQNNLRIINMGITGDYIIVFSTNKDNDMDKPDGTYGQIWKFRFDKVVGRIDSKYIDGNDNLTLDESLIVNRVLNYSTANKIFFETYIKNENVIKIYMYDGHNILKHLNIMDPNSKGLFNSAMDILADVKFSYPVPIEVIESGNLRSGQYRYAYQMYNIDGSQTTYSPTSIGMNMYPGDYYNTNDMDVIGGPIEEICSKSLRLTIDGLDLSYEKVRIVSILYPNFTGIPEITIIKDTGIPETGSITFVDDGTTVFGAVTIQEFRTLGTELFIPLTAEVKDNMLICANKIEKRFELKDDVWDARAYRFGSEQTATTIWSISGVLTVISSASSNSTNWNVPLKHDCVQDFDEQDIRKYQVNNLILGGEGPSIKYEFVMGPEIILQDKIIRGQTVVSSSGAVVVTDQLDAPKQVKFTSVSANNEVYDFNGTQYTNFSYANYASPIIAGLFKGYAKNEVYRFGIEFFNKKGKKCFVKWIADIKFPDFGDNIKNDWNGTQIDGGIYSLTNCTHSTPETPHTNGLPAEDDSAGWRPDTPGTGYDKFDQVKARPLGIRFILKNIPIDEDGNPYDYRIVRAERREEDKRIVMQGPLMGIQNPTGNDPYYRPLTLNTFSRNERVVHIPHYDPDILDDQDYRFGTYGALLGWSPWESLKTGSNDQDEFTNTNRVKWIKQLREHMFISPELYFIDNYILPEGLDFAPVGIAHIQERDVVDSYMAGGVFREKDADLDDPADNYLMITGAPQFYWGPDYLRNMESNIITLNDAVIVPSPAPDFNLGTAVYSVVANTAGDSFTYRNVVATKQPEESDVKESVRAGKRLIVSFKEYFPGWNEGVAPGDPGNRNQRLVDSHEDVLESSTQYNHNYQLLTSYVIGRMQRTLGNQYGGNSYYDRTQTTYIPASPIIKGTSVNAATFEGDIYINVFDYLNLQFSHRLHGDSGAGIMETQWFILESTINVDMHSGISYNDSVDIGTPASHNDTTSPERKDWRGNFNVQEQGGGVYGIPNVQQAQYVQNYNLTDYNTSYISDNRVGISIPQPLNYDSNTYFYARIHRSLDKVYDDVYDRWLVFLPDNWKDVNTAYGGITNLIEYANKLYYFQERALGIMGINEMALEQTDQAGATLLLGKADVMDQYVYIDSNHGVTIPNSVYSVPQGIIGFDSEQLKMFIVGAKGINELSVMLGIQASIKENTLFKSMDFHGVYDSYNSRSYNILTGIGYAIAIPTMLADLLPIGREYKTFNFSYNTAINAFESTYDFTPDSIISYKGILMSSNPTNENIWIHGSTTRCNYYGVQYKWWITPIVNTEAIFNHMLTNFEVNLDHSDPPEAIQVSLFPSSAGSGTQHTFKRRLNTWRCQAPRASGTEKDRMRGHTFAVQLKGAHTDRAVTHSLLSYSIPNIQ